MGRTTYHPSRIRFAADEASLTRTTGRQIDWDNVPASYENADGVKEIPAGTAVSVVSGGGPGVVPRVDRDVGAEPTETAIGLLETQATEGERQAALTGYGLVVGGVVYENLLPDADHADWDTVKTELQAAGTGFAFTDYTDDRAT